MNTQGAGTHSLQQAVLLVKKAPEKEDKHIARSLGVNTRKVKGQLQLNQPARQREARRASASSASSKRKFRGNVGPEIIRAESQYGKTWFQTPAWTTTILESLGSWHFVSNWLGTRQQDLMYLFKHLRLKGMHTELPKELADVIMWPLCMRKCTQTESVPRVGKRLICPF